MKFLYGRSLFCFGITIQIQWEAINRIRKKKHPKLSDVKDKEKYFKSDSEIPQI
jgi:hypothetical protein